MIHGSKHMVRLVRFLYPPVKMAFGLACFMLLLSSSMQLFGQSRDVVVTIYLRGVFQSKISMLTLSPSGLFKPGPEIKEVKNGEKTQLKIAANYLPGEFVLRFDYSEKENSSPYPCEKRIFISDQDLELRVNPMFCNAPDSTWFEKGELENTSFDRFSSESVMKKEQLGLLQNFLLNYDQPGSKFYQQGIREYEQRRQSYNKWLSEKTYKDRGLFISTLYGFQYIPEISWEGSETDRTRNLIAHYFDRIDFNNPNLIKTSGMNKFLDGYVNLYGQMSTTIALRDSLFPLAGKTAIEKAKKGHPLVYGWMVDYFYRGYESNNIPAGMKVLESYLNDPACPTSKRQEITRRLKGMESLIAGSKAPDIEMNDISDQPFNLYRFQTASRYILILFWSAGCSHCMETVKALNPWSQKSEIRDLISVIAIGLDETAEDQVRYHEEIKQLAGWQHFHAPEGVRSKVASDYYILATPVMVLMNAAGKEILAIPSSPAELYESVH
ncbi:MAG: redoxin domain-containing protein [Alphaproteobacteria bacterium]|nr:redoxin domain-containing protein [Alphaproteobacteria bacterium]